MIGFAKRNLLIFFRDKAAVFFSLLAVFLIIGLYALFLGDVWVNSFTGMSGVRYLMDSWIMAGLLAVTSVTTTMGAFGIMVEDKTKKIIKDFTSSPLKRSRIAGGYILSSYLIGCIMSFITLVLAEIYVVMNGGELLEPATLVKVAGLILLSTLSNTSLVLFMVSFFNSANAFSTASTILGTLIGFLTGIYLPIGQLPEAVQWMIKAFPVSHSAVLLRQVMMAEPLSATFAGAPDSAVQEFEELMGVTYKFGDTTVTPLMSIAVLIVTTAVFYGLSIWNLSRKKS
ncbi:MAG TPA: ABC transporter permease [Oscillospiraceae bacterium]|nr:ABC transporter permease [Oscillospiraceae bacterium]HRW57076.1 ABC transporter permease [Oscillospiraceae bacterium]